MVWFSYHGGHSGEFCGHAKGQLEPVVQRAIEAGFTHYSLSEHCPRYRDQDLYGEEHTAGLTPASPSATAKHPRVMHPLIVRRMFTAPGS